jgi:lipopolysaccharide transport system ATP-binding protein
MSANIIHVENLSKQFIISHEKQERYTALRDVISKKAKKIFSINGKAGGRNEKGSKEIFWALKDINFDIKQGERVGIIGRNGAGKSTLLKILSRITEPSSGRITIKGKVASLLEVGTGFHPELTGRENIFLNGAILGMSRSEIRRKFDEIVAFAEVEYFLDTPVKRYSSGMFVRLAFSVAAHLEPEILIVDEVLAVGDAQFQKKCLGKMEEVSKNEGRTVLFVSHNLAAVKALCNSAIILHKGEKILQGEVFESIAKYFLFDQKQLNDKTKYTRIEIPTGKKMFLQEVEFIDNQSRNDFRIEVKLKIHSTINTKIGINLRLKDGMSFPVSYGCSHYFAPDLSLVTQGENNFILTSAPMNLASGQFKISVELVIPGSESLDLLEDCVQFELSNDGLANRSYGVMQEWGFGATEIKITSIQ